MVSGLLMRQLSGYLNGATSSRVWGNQVANILVVEDEPANLRMLTYILNDEGYETIGASDGVEALELLAQSRFDLVLSDINMPRMDGVALARHIVSSNPITPIFLMTAYDFDNCQDILQLRVPCLKKPVPLDSLLSRIRIVIGEER
jgi:CheY-like chemotaxis protein